MTPRVTASDERFAQVGELELCWQEFGEQGNPPLLMVMGLGAQMILWPDEMCEMIAARGFRVIRFDNRDAGRSTILEDAPTGTVPRALGGEIEPGSYILSDMAADAAGLLDALGIEAAHVVGASLGGMIAQTLAFEHPQRVLSLASIMSNTGDRRHGRVHRSLLLKAPKTVAKTRDEAVDKGIETFRLISGPHFDEHEPDLRALLEAALARSWDIAGTARQSMAIAASPDRTEALGSVTAPTLVIHGLVDPLVRPSGGFATAKAIPGSRLLAFPDMGHDLPRARWDEIISAIVDNAQRGGFKGSDALVATD